MDCIAGNSICIRVAPKMHSPAGITGSGNNIIADGAVGYSRENHPSPTIMSRRQGAIFDCDSRSEISRNNAVKGCTYAKTSTIENYIV